ncbi:MAG: pyridoxal phosphate-dependent aminotransferase [Acidobacteriota bacterium]
MPRPPGFSRAVEATRGAVYSPLVHVVEQIEGETYPFHVGDTWRDPVVGAHMQDLATDALPGLHRYTATDGTPELLEALRRRVSERTGLDLSRRRIHVTAGATAGLGVVMASLLDPDDEVLILAPYWPLIEGIVRTYRGVPVPVPVEDAISPPDFVERLDAVLTSRTAAVYVSSPNNPTGRVLPAEVLKALSDWATEKGLWIVSDEVYEEYVFEGEHTPMLPLSPDNTITAYSFSKAFGMAGNRCGYLAGPEALLDEVRKVGTHTYYSAPTSAQHAALAALEGDVDEWVAESRRLYRTIGTEVALLLGVDPPDGGTFLFLDLRSRLDERGVAPVLEECAEQGILLAPGPSFGPYEGWVRLCFTAVAPDVTSRGARKLAEILER